ncbi:MAG: DUF6335 family protein [Leptolyngbyaceae bacterium]|nr:DUF6335 family protein [Leptolyngbyaceae bacterium]
MTPSKNPQTNRLPVNNKDRAPEVPEVEMEPVMPDETRPQDETTLQDEAVGDQALQTGISDRNTQTSAVFDDMSQPMASGSSVTGGDVDAMNEQAKVVGEEAIGGTTPTPDQSNVDDIADSVGVDFEPNEPVKVAEEMLERDRHRWELEPDSR